MTKHTVLFLAANPLGMDRLALDEEARAIQEELERSGYRDQFELVTRWAVRPLDLLRALRKLKPTIVHFCGHGGHGELAPCVGPPRDVISEAGVVDAERQQGLFFQGPDGRPQLVTTEALQETFGAAGLSVKLVVLSACYSEAQAAVLLAYVESVVGVCGSIRDNAATTFAVGFYGALGDGESIAAAYRQGCAAISLGGLSYSERPQLKLRNTSDLGKMTTSATNVARQNVEMGERREPLEYYVYISDTKVDMLMAQVVERAVANATFTLEERIVRLRTVVRDLRIHNIIGTVADESEYIEGIANLSWGTMAFGSERRSFAFFVGEVGGDLLLLLGSTHNIIGVPRISRHIGASHYFWIMQILQKLDAEQQSAHKSTRDEVSHLISIFVKAEYPRQRLRFFAKRYGKYKAFTVGSPVFVAMAD